MTNIFEYIDIAKIIINLISTADSINLSKTCKLMHSINYCISGYIKVTDEYDETTKNQCIRISKTLNRKNVHLQKVVLIFDNIDYHHLNLLNVKVNEITVDHVGKPKYPMILFPPKIEKLIATKYPHKIRNVVCNIAKVQYINRYMIDTCADITIYNQNSYAKFKNKKIISMKLRERDFYYYCKKNYPFDNLEEFDIDYKLVGMHTNIHVNMLIVNNTKNSRVTNKICGPSVVRYTNRHLPKKIFIYGDRYIIHYLNPQTSRVRNIPCPNAPGILRNEKLPKNFCSTNMTLTEIDNNYDYRLVSDLYCVQINYCSSFKSVTKTIKINHFIGSLEHYEQLMNSEIIVEKFFWDFNVNEKKYDIYNHKINNLVLYKESYPKILFTNVSILEIKSKIPDCVKFTVLYRIIAPIQTKYNNYPDTLITYQI